MFIEDEGQYDNLKSKYGWTDVEEIRISKTNFVIPGFIDTHIHAPQYSFTGTGYDLELLDWLKKYTFPSESKLKDQELAKSVYTNLIMNTLQNGTTTACYYATIHLESTKLLVDLLYQNGQRAFVGKVNMDRNGEDYYEENTNDSLEETKQFINYCQSAYEREKGNNPHFVIKPIITPRFVPTCTPTLMSGLGDLAKQYDLPIQSHISENKGEVLWVSGLHPECKSYAEVYDKHGLLTNKTIMGHAIHLTDDEIQLFKDRDAGISHCPVSNFALRSGVFPLRKVLKKGVKVGLGTDVSGGYSISMLEVMRQAVIASTTISFNDAASEPLSFKEVFYLATLGSAHVAGLGDKIGSFEVGKYFDALEINPDSGTLFTNLPPIADTTEDIFQKFIFLGNSLNIARVFVQGLTRFIR